MKAKKLNKALNDFLGFQESQMNIMSRRMQTAADIVKVHPDTLKAAHKAAVESYVQGQKVEQMLQSLMVQLIDKVAALETKVDALTAKRKPKASEL